MEIELRTTQGILGALNLDKELITSHKISNAPNLAWEETHTLGVGTNSEHLAGNKPTLGEVLLKILSLSTSATMTTNGLWSLGKRNNSNNQNSHIRFVSPDHPPSQDVYPKITLQAFPKGAGADSVVFTDTTTILEVHPESIVAEVTPSMSARPVSSEEAPLGTASFGKEQSAAPGPPPSPSTNGEHLLQAPLTGPLNTYNQGIQEAPPDGSLAPTRDENTENSSNFVANSTELCC